MPKAEAFQRLFSFFAAKVRVVFKRAIQLIFTARILVKLRQVVEADLHTLDKLL